MNSFVKPDLMRAYCQLQKNGNMNAIYFSLNFMNLRLTVTYK